MTEQERTRDGRSGAAGDATRLWQLLLPIVAPTTVIAALMVYFGLVRVSGKYAVFGLTSDTLDLSLQDYMINSPDAMFRSMVGPLLAVVVLGPAYAVLIARLAARPRVAHRMAQGAVILGTLACLYGFLGTVGLLHPATTVPVVPISIFLGVLLLGFAGRLRTLTGRRASWLETEAPLLHMFGTLAFVILLALTLFWAGAVYVRGQAFQAAYDRRASPRRLPSAVVYAPERLYIDGDGVTETVLPQVAGHIPHYRYRYEGLLLLIHTSDRYFLLPACWGFGGGRRTIALPDHSSIRVDFSVAEGDRARRCR